MRPSLSKVLTFLGGYVDTLSFLSLNGLFAGHVTGNFVTLGASLASGSHGALSKSLALPTFCIVVFLARVIGIKLRNRGRHAQKPMLIFEALLLSVVGVVAIIHGPFNNPDDTTALAVGMTLVTAMAIQNALHRVHLPKSPPSTIMTGTTTQVMLDIGEIAVSGRSASDAIYRVKTMIPSVLIFACGCASSAFAFSALESWAFAVPIVLGFASLHAAVETPEGDASSGRLRDTK